MNITKEQYESEYDSDDEEVLKKKIVSKRAKKTRDTILKEELEDQIQREHKLSDLGLRHGHKGLVFQGIDRWHHDD